jgi:phenylacetate-CoA ligase
MQSSEFYRRRFAVPDVWKLESIKQFRDQVPMLSRSEFRTNYAQIKSPHWKASNLLKYETSGTTGAALQFFHPRWDRSRQWAALHHQWKRVGYQPGKSLRAEFRGLTRDRSLIRKFPEQNMIRCSIFHLRPEHLRYYADEISKYEIEFLHGYPSVLYLVAKEILNSGISFPAPKGIILGSEMIYEWQADVIKQAFPNAKIISVYNCTERTVLAGWCEHREEYHVMPQYSLVEIEHETSEIIGTNLFNTVNGFVRYGMSDSVMETAENNCPACGRAYTPRLVQLNGRSGDFIYSPQYGWIAPAIVTYPLKSLRHIHEMQFVQQEKNTILMRYTTHEQSQPRQLQKELDTLERDLHLILGNAIVFRQERIYGFSKGSTGKFKWIISELDEVW